MNPEQADTGDTPGAQGRSVDVPSLMPTGETPEEWKARHNAVFDRCLKYGTRKFVRVRILPIR